jgi:hypothetical protein
MTAEETSTITRRGYLYGLWVAVSLVLPLQPISIGFATGKVNPILFATGALLVTTHFICIPIWQRRQRQFLCGTRWAREKDIQPESLKLFSFRTRRKA